MENELASLKKNRKRLIITFIIMIFVFIAMITSLLFGKYVDSTHTLSKNILKSTNIINTFFTIPYFIILLCAYLFFFIYIQNYYDLLVKYKIKIAYRYWFLYYLSFFIPIVKYFVPLIGILFLLWNICSVKNKVFIVFVYYLPVICILLIFNLDLNLGIISKINDEIIIQVLIKGISNLLKWISILIIIRLMDSLLVKAIANKKLDESNLTTAST